MTLQKEKWGDNLGAGPEFSFMNEEWYIALDGAKRAKVLAEARVDGSYTVNGQAILEKVLGITLENEEQVVLDALRDAAHRMGSGNESLGASYGMAIAPYGGSGEGGVSAQLKKDLEDATSVSALGTDVAKKK